MISCLSRWGSKFFTQQLCDCCSGRADGSSTNRLFLLSQLSWRAPLEKQGFFSLSATAGAVGDVSVAFPLSDPPLFALGSLFSVLFRNLSGFRTDRSLFGHFGLLFLSLAFGGLLRFLFRRSRFFFSGAGVLSAFSMSLPGIGASGFVLAILWYSCASFSVMS